MRFNREFVSEVLSSFRHRRRRLVLTGLGVSGSVFLLVVLMAAGNGLEKGVHNRFRSITTHSIYFYPNSTSKSFGSMPQGRNLRFSYYDFLAVRRAYRAEADGITCRTMDGQVKVLHHGAVTTTANFAAVEAGSERTRPLNWLEGRVLSEEDSRLRRKVIFLGRVLKEDLFGQEPALGRWIRVDGSFYEIAGIFESFKEGEASRFDDNLALIPQTVYNTVYNQSDVGSIEITCSDPERYAALLKNVGALLKTRMQVHPSDDNAILVSDTRREFSKYTSLFRNIRIFLWLVSIGMLAMGLMSVSHVILITVNERMREIGVRRAVGSSPSEIQWMVLCEAIGLTLLAGLAGLLAGVGFVFGIAQLMNRFRWNSEFFMHPAVHLDLIFLCILLLVVAGAIAGYVPARRAARIKPIDVLRHE